MVLILKKWWWAMLLAIFIALQFIPLRGRENAALDPANDLLSVLPDPSGEAGLLIRAACYDCHSDEVKYPWYAQVAPLSFWLQNHVNEGREHLNYSRFGKLSQHDRDHALEENVEMLEKQNMPLESYVWMHPEANLTLAQRAQLIDFFSASIANPED